MGWLTDTHCHLNLDVFQGIMDQTLERAWERGIERILVPATNVETSRTAVALAERYGSLYAAVGVHPGDAASWQADTLAALRDLAQHPKVAAIGEIGLDYYRDHAPRPQQREVFRAQLALAGELGLPVVVHNRDAMDDVMDDVSTWLSGLEQSGSALIGRPGVLHSYDGTLDAAQQAIAKGFFIGISGPVTFKNARERQSLVAALPLDHLLVETDAPFLTPQPYRGRWPNEPAHVYYVSEKIAELHHLPLDAVQQATGENAAKLFHWGANS